MRKVFQISATLSGVLLLSGCITPALYETDPVEVSTASGTVTCQLYTDDLLDWDRSIDRPASMSVKTADQICRNEGAKRLEALKVG